jgi:hypothetical protein
MILDFIAVGLVGMVLRPLFDRYVVNPIAAWITICQMNDCGD